MLCSNSDDSAGKEYALLKRKVFSWRQKDEYGRPSECWHSDTGRVFQGLA